MRCRARGCRKILGVRATSIVCSAVCEDLLRREIESYLEVLDRKVRARDLAPYYRDVNLVSKVARRT